MLLLTYLLGLRWSLIVIYLVFVHLPARCLLLNILFFVQYFAYYYNLFMGKPTFVGRRGFGSVLDIIPLADSITKLTARCELCGKRAFFTLRKTEEMQTELIGGADKYMPVCRHHYVNGQAVIEAARNVLESHKVLSDPLLGAAAV